MSDFLRDAEIDTLIKESKELPADFRNKLKMRPKRGHKESELDIRGVKGDEFRIILRQNLINQLDFSVILGFRPIKSNQIFRLCRYNGKHFHTNKLEKDTFYQFHIHYATERYQENGFKEDAFASPTDRYSDILGAINCMFEDCAFQVAGDAQIGLF